MIAVVVIHAQNMQTIINKLAEVEARFTATQQGLQRGETISPAATKEMARIGAHHARETSAYVRWTTQWPWTLMVPGVLAAGMQGWLCSMRKAKT